jgi:hypothetical protein
MTNPKVENRKTKLLGIYNDYQLWETNYDCFPNKPQLEVIKNGHVMGFITNCSEPCLCPGLKLTQTDTRAEA